MAQKFKAGDRVRIVGYGHPHWIRKDAWPGYAQMDVRAQMDEYFLWFGKYPDTPPVPKEKPPNILHEDDTTYYVDMMPMIVGQEGTIIGSYADLSEKYHWGSARDEQTEKDYSIEGIPGKQSWYDEQQLELIEHE